MKVGYARVSTLDQETHLQMDALRRAGCEVIFVEKVSSVAIAKRLELVRCLESLKPGDTLVVYKIDRLARSLKHLLSIMETMDKAGAGFASLTEPIDTTTAAGRMMMQMLGAVAEFERSLIRERSIAGQRAARERGAIVGRPRAMAPAEEAQLVVAYREGRMTLDAVAQRFGVHPATAKRAVYRAAKPASTSLL